MNYINPIFNSINIPQIRFRATAPNTYFDVTSPRKDSFNSNPLYDNFANKNTITQLAKSNPQVMQILRENKIPLKVNMKELEDLKNGHLMDTRVTAAKIYSALPQNMKEQVNLMDLQQAAMLHDYGKALIPEKILNKNGKLTNEEKKIMDLHSELGYELLKQQGVKQNVLNLIKYHHQNPQGTGYPSVGEDYTHDISAQILATADKYSALREKRSYKEPLSRNDALEIINEDVENGQIAPEIYTALEKTV